MTGAAPDLRFRISARTSWLSGCKWSKRTPIPGATPLRAGSCSRIHTTVPSPTMSGLPSWSWNSNRSLVPTSKGSLVRMKMPPLLTSTEYRSMNWVNVALRNLIFSLTGARVSVRVPPGPSLMLNPRSSFKRTVSTQVSPTETPPTQDRSAHHQKSPRLGTAFETSLIIVPRSPALAMNNLSNRLKSHSVHTRCTSFTQGAIRWVYWWFS